MVLSVKVARQGRDRVRATPGLTGCQACRLDAIRRYRKRAFLVGHGQRGKAEEEGEGGFVGGVWACSRPSRAKANKSQRRKRLAWLAVGEKKEDHVRRGEAESDGVDLTRVFWVGSVKLVVQENLEQNERERRERVLQQAFKQEWIVRRDTLLRNVIAHAAVEGVLENAVVLQLLAGADNSDTPLFRTISKELLAQLCKGFGCMTTADKELEAFLDDAEDAEGKVEGVEVDVENFPSAMRRKREEKRRHSQLRESLLSSLLAWGQQREDVVIQPDEFRNMNFSWNLVEQPYIARVAPWRTIITVKGSCANEARGKVGHSLDCNICAMEDEVLAANQLSLSGYGKDMCSGSSTTKAAFEIPLLNADGILLELDTGSDNEQSVHIDLKHLVLLKHTLLTFFKSDDKTSEWISDSSSLISIKQREGSPHVNEIKFSSFADGTDDVTILAEPAQLHCLLDIVDFVTMHPATLPLLSTELMEGKHYDLNEREIYKRKIGLRNMKRVTRMLLSGALALIFAGLLANRKAVVAQQCIQKIEGFSSTFTSLFVDQYRSLVVRKGLDISGESQVPASSVKRNKATVDVLSSILRTATEKGGRVSTNVEGLGSHRGTLLFQVVMSRSGHLMGVSPANKEAVNRWKDLILVQELYQEAKGYDVGQGGIKQGLGGQKQRELEEEDTFVFELAIHSGGKVEIQPWDIGKGSIVV